MGLIKKYLLFTFSSLMSTSLLMFFSIRSKTTYGFSSIFYLQKPIIIFIAFIGVVFLLIRHKTKTTNRTVNAPLLLISLLLFSLSFYIYGDINKVYNEGVSIKSSQLIDSPGKIDLDSSSLLSIPLLTGIRQSYDSFIFGEGKIKKILDMGEIQEETILTFHTLWQDAPLSKDPDLIFQSMDDNQLNKDLKVFLSINNRSFDISDSYKDLPEDKGKWISIKIPGNNFLDGKNEIIISTKNNSDLLRFSGQVVFMEGNTFKFDNEGFWETEITEMALFLNRENPFWFSLLFKFSFILKIAALILFLFAFFNKKIITKIIKNNKKEIIYSILALLILYYLSLFIQSQWQFLSRFVAYSIYFLLKISFLNPSVNINDLSAPLVGLNNFSVEIADVCSGVESLIYFLVAYSLLLLIHWKHINFNKALVLFIPGIIGAALLNIFRIYFLILIGSFFSKQLALNLFHSVSGMLIFIIYFIIFWPLALKYIEK